MAFIAFSQFDSRRGRSRGPGCWPPPRCRCWSSTIAAAAAQPACLAGHDAFPGWLVGCLDPRMLPLLALPGCGLARLWRVGVCLGALAAAAAPEQQELPFFVADGKMQR